MGAWSGHFPLNTDQLAELDELERYLADQLGVPPGVIPLEVSHVVGEDMLSRGAEDDPSPYAPRDWSEMRERLRTETIAEYLHGGQFPESWHEWAAKVGGRTGVVPG